MSDSTELGKPEMDFMRAETLQHILEVRSALDVICKELIDRGRIHDQSKLGPFELESFARMTPKLKKLTYGSPEYKEALKELGPALKHHYENNRHHPEYHEKGIRDMNLVDVVEMLADWLAASKRHEDGCIRRSIDHNQGRFEYSDDLKAIFHNTVELFENG